MSDYRAMYDRLAGKLADVVDILIEILQAEENTIIEDTALAVLPEDTPVANEKDSF